MGHNSFVFAHIFTEKHRHRRSMPPPPAPMGNPGSATAHGVTVVDPGVAPSPPPIGPNSFIFAYIFAKKLPHRTLVPPKGLEPPPPQLEILEPPLSDNQGMVDTSLPVSQRLGPGILLCYLNFAANSTVQMRQQNGEVVLFEKRRSGTGSATKEHGKIYTQKGTLY